MRQPQLSHEVWSFVSQVEPAKGMLNPARQAGHPSAMDFSQLRMPVLLISAEDDRFGTAAAARKIATVVPQAELTVLPDGGHIRLGQDDEVAQLIHRFLALSLWELSFAELYRTGTVSLTHFENAPDHVHPLNERPLRSGAVEHGDDLIVSGSGQAGFGRRKAESRHCPRRGTDGRCREHVGHSALR